MVGIYKASSVVCIDQVHFLSANAHDLPDVLPLATGLIINQTNNIIQMENSLMVKVTNSLFSQSGRLNISKTCFCFICFLMIIILLYKCLLAKQTSHQHHTILDG